MPFSCTRTRKSSSPRSTGRDAPGARPADVAPGRVKNRLPKLWAGLAWIWLLVIVVSEAAGWLNGDVAAGWPAVVALGAAEGVGVVAGGGGVVTLAGAPGLAVRACDRGGAGTVAAGAGRVRGGFGAPR